MSVCTFCTRGVGRVAPCPAAYVRALRRARPRPPSAAANPRGDYPSHQQLSYKFFQVTYH